VGYAENTGGFVSLGADLPKPSRTKVFTAATGVTPTWIASGAIQCDGAQVQDAAGTARSPDSRHADCKSEGA